jgi:hypothetical protein
MTVLREGNRGPDVGELHRQLGEAGYPVDAEEVERQSYGPSTVIAVRALQVAARLDADGVYGPATARVLLPQDRESFTAPGWRCRTEGLSSDVAAVLEWLRGWIGVVEEPPRSNRGPRIDALWPRGSTLGQPWCAALVSRAMERAPNSRLRKFLGSVYKIREAAQAGGFLVKQPRPGDIAGYVHVVRDDAGKVISMPGHVGVVCHVEAGQVHVIEGNARDACRGTVSDGSRWQWYARAIPLV